MSGAELVHPASASFTGRPRAVSQPLISNLLKSMSGNAPAAAAEPTGAARASAAPAAETAISANLAALRQPMATLSTLPADPVPSHGTQQTPQPPAALRANPPAATPAPSLQPSTPSGAARAAPPSQASRPAGADAQPSSSSSAAAPAATTANKLFSQVVGTSASEQQRQRHAAFTAKANAARAHLPRDPALLRRLQAQLPGDVGKMDHNYVFDAVANIKGVLAVDWLAGHATVTFDSEENRAAAILCGFPLGKRMVKLIGRDETLKVIAFNAPRFITDEDLVNDVNVAIKKAGINHITFTNVKRENNEAGFLSKDAILFAPANTPDAIADAKKLPSTVKLYCEAEVSLMVKNPELQNRSQLHCFRCHGDHARENCAKAPKCNHCGARSHPSWRCKNVPSDAPPQRSPTGKRRHSPANSHSQGPNKRTPAAFAAENAPASPTAPRQPRAQAAAAPHQAAAPVAAAPRQAAAPAAAAPHQAATPVAAAPHQAATSGAAASRQPAASAAAASHQAATPVAAASHQAATSAAAAAHLPATPVDATPSQASHEQSAHEDQSTAAPSADITAAPAKKQRQRPNASDLLDREPDPQQATDPPAVTLPIPLTMQDFQSAGVPASSHPAPANSSPSAGGSLSDEL